PWASEHAHLVAPAEGAASGPARAGWRFITSYAIAAVLAVIDVGLGVQVRRPAGTAAGSSRRATGRVRAEHVASQSGRGIRGGTGRCRGSRGLGRIRAEAKRRRDAHARGAESARRIGVAHPFVLARRGSACAGRTICPACALDRRSESVSRSWSAPARWGGSRARRRRTPESIRFRVFSWSGNSRPPGATA